MLSLLVVFPQGVAVGPGYVALSGRTNLRSFFFGLKAQSILIQWNAPGIKCECIRRP